MFTRVLTALLCISFLYGCSSNGSSGEAIIAAPWSSNPDMPGVFSDLKQSDGTLFYTNENTLPLNNARGYSLSIVGCELGDASGTCADSGISVALVDNDSITVSYSDFQTPVGSIVITISGDSREQGLRYYMRVEEGVNVPYSIYTPELLGVVQYNLDRSFVLTDNVTTPEGVWQPIGTMSAPFTGTFDGDNNTISGLRITGGMDNVYGLFGYVLGDGENKGVIQNITVKSVNTADDNVSCEMNSNSGVGGVGIIAGVIRDGKIINAVADYTHLNILVALADGCNAGGIAGEVYSSTISQSHSAGDITNEIYVGGVAGYIADSIVSQSYSTGNVTGKNGVGGVVAFASRSTVNKSYNTSAVTGESMVGGVVGYVGDNSTVNESYSAGSVTGVALVGGVIGDALDSTISNNISLNSAITSTSNMGGIVGGNSFSLVSDNYDRGTTVAIGTGINGAVIPGFTGANFAAMFGYLDETAFYAIWNMQKGNTSNDPANRPLLNANKEAAQTTP